MDMLLCIVYRLALRTRGLVAGDRSVGHGLGPSMGWVGSDFFLIFGGLGWVGWRLDCVIFLTS